jgi:hypothetical protein
MLFLNMVCLTGASPSTKKHRTKRKTKRKEKKKEKKRNEEKGKEPRRRENEHGRRSWGPGGPWIPNVRYLKTLPCLLTLKPTGGSRLDRGQPPIG